MLRDEKINKCIEYCKKEKSMRFIVFKNRPQEQYEKMQEMEFIIHTLEELL